MTTKLPHRDGRWQAVDNLSATWLPRSGGRPPTQPADPAWPKGQDIDFADGRSDVPTCAATLPWVDNKIGLYLVDCSFCGQRVAITVAGRKDDPLATRLVCMPRKQLRPLVIDDAAKAEVARVVAWAKDHELDTNNPTFIPGNDPHFVAKLGTYRTVFTFTRAGDALFRHLSVSVPGEKYPNPVAMWILADLYGFTGWTVELGPKPAVDWDVQLHEHSVQVLQQIPTGKLN